MKTESYIDTNGTLVTILPPQKVTKTMKRWSKPEYGKESISHRGHHRDCMRNGGFAKA